MLELERRGWFPGGPRVATMVLMTVIAVGVAANGLLSGQGRSGSVAVLVVLVVGLALAPRLPGRLVRLEVGDAAIVLHDDRRPLRRMERTATGSLIVTARARSHLLQWTEQGRTRRLMLVPGVDGEALHGALGAHGWLPGGAARPMPTARTLAVPGDRAALRSPVTWVLLALAGVPLVPALLGQSVLSEPWSFYALLLAVYVGGVALVRPREVTVTPERVVYRTGIVTRTCLRPGAKVHEYRGRLVIVAGRTVLRVPPGTARDELLALLHFNGWL